MGGGKSGRWEEEVEGGVKEEGEGRREVGEKEVEGLVGEEEGRWEEKEVETRSGGG